MFNNPLDILVINVYDKIDICELNNFKFLHNFKIQKLMGYSSRTLK